MWKGILLGVLLAGAAQAQPAPPAGLVVREGDGSVLVRWNAAPGATGYRLYRAAADSAFRPVLPVAARATYYADWNVENGVRYRYTVASFAGGATGAPGDTVAATPHALDDDAFLDLVTHLAFDFFWYEANPANGLVKDRSTPGSAASIASVGFGLTAYGVAVEKGWITRDEARARTLATLDFLWNAEQSTASDATGYRGFFYHFLDMNTGKRAGTTELSTIDTALLMGGVLYAAQFFDGADADEARIRTLADSIYRRVDWNWASPRPPLVALGWKPEAGFLPYDWRGYNEALVLYVLALGSPTHALPAAAWAEWTRTYDWRTYYSPLPYVPFPPLFGHQYSHVWIDFRGTRDAFMRGHDSDYFENSRRATLAQRAYTTANPRGFAGYGPDGWGITASDYPGGYRARGALPVQNDDGTLVPTGPGGSYAFTPDESLAALRNFYANYPRLWGAYGFKDAFNPTQNWYATDHIGIDQGPIVLMIENGRRDAVWRVFMQSPYVQAGMERAGFERVGTATAPGARVDALALAVYPNPARGAATATVTGLLAGAATLTLFDPLGRRVWQREVGPGGVEPLNLAGLAGGVYVLRLETPVGSLARAFLHLP